MPGQTGIPLRVVEFEQAKQGVMSRGRIVDT